MAKEDKAEETSGEVSTDLRAEIDGAVETVVSGLEAERQARDVAADVKKDVETEVDTSVDGSGGKTPEDGKKGDDDAGVIPPAITDALVERAVKAGMSISDAKTFQTADALDRMCSMLEKREAGDGKGAGADGKGKDEKVEEEVDPLAAIPDLDPEKYDENVVAGFKAMKDIIRKQHEAITGMRGEGKSRDVSWFDGQVAALGEGFVEAVGTGDRSKLDPNGPQAKTLAALNDKFTVLSEGYKAAGKDMSRDSVFKEAVSIVLGDVQAKAEATVKAGELAKRSRLHIARPSGGSQKAATDAFSDVASDLDRKFFGKK